MLESFLDEIPSLGEVRRRALLEHFGSVAALRKASVSDIGAIPGISAAVMMAEVAATAAHDGTTVEARLRSIRDTYGDAIVVERSLRMSPATAAPSMARLMSEPPSTLLGRAVGPVERFPDAGLVRLWCGPIRLQVRPSGTEPKVKLYGEGVGEDPGPLLDALADWLVDAR